MYCASVGLVLLFILSLSKLLAVNSNSDCDYNPAISEPVKSLLCAVESGVLKIDSESNAMVSAGCLIGMKGRCEAPMRIPTETEIPPSPAPPAAKIKQYQHLATIAEGFVEQTWWRYCINILTYDLLLSCCRCSFSLNLTFLGKDLLLISCYSHTMILSYRGSNFHHRRYGTRGSRICTSVSCDSISLGSLMISITIWIPALLTRRRRSTNVRPWR